VLILLVAGCSSGKHADPIILKGPSAVVPQNSAHPCTQADLDGPALTMPSPQVITSSVFFTSGIVATLDPTVGGGSPRLLASDAWAKFTQGRSLHARQADLMLGTFSAVLPYGPGGPHPVSVPAWVLQLHDLAYAQPKIGAGGIGSGLKSSVCQFVDALLVLNADTGAVVVYSY
jgi:hypothetical protein